MSKFTTWQILILRKKKIEAFIFFVLNLNIQKEEIEVKDPFLYDHNKNEQVIT